MTDPQPVAIHHLPGKVRERIGSHLGKGGNAATYIGVETNEERSERLKRAQDRLEAFWGRRVPSEFHEAHLRDLDEAQGRTTVQHWLDSGSRVLVLVSETPGTGKSHAAYAVGNEAVKMRLMWAAAWTEIDLLKALRPNNDPSAMEVAVECDLLVLDDLGRARLNDWSLEQLHDVLDTRWSEGRRLVVTTNLPGEKLIERYGDPFVDRILDGMTLVKMSGPSRRKPAPW